MSNDITGNAIWAALARHDRPARALIGYAAAQDDPQTALDLILGELTDEERSALGPLIATETSLAHQET